jgi:hypothetical protein
MPQSNRFVYAYIREKDDAGGKSGTPYYIGKGTIRRIYDWVNHGRTKLPFDPRNIHVLGRDMSDEDARQAEMLLIYLYGRYDHTYARFGWARGILDNRTDGGDGPANPEHADTVQAVDSRFYDHNENFTLKYNEAGHYWYSAIWPMGAKTLP